MQGKKTFSVLFDKGHSSRKKKKLLKHNFRFADAIFTLFYTNKFNGKKPCKIKCGRKTRQFSKDCDQINMNIH
jgi:hypothetical protein